jgi:two-component system phosphate regulon sensor histidine kinase PhoR
LLNPWVREVWRAALLLIAALLAGWLVGNFLATLLIVVLGYLAWHLYNLYKLERWYHQRKRFHPPQATGIWGEVFHHVYRLQQRNRQRKKRLASIVGRFNESTSAMPDATVVLDKGGHIEWFNKAATRYLGLNAKQDTGQRIDNLIRHPRFVEYMHNRDFSQALTIPSPLDDGRSFSVRVVPYGKGQQLLVMRDITRLKHLERVRKDFVANVSHEIKTPLTVLAGYLENMADADDQFSQRWSKGLSQMQDQTQRMSRIVEDLLLLSRLEDGENKLPRDPVAVPAMLAGLKEEGELLAGANTHNFHMEVEQDLWLTGSEKILHSVFANLIFNAVRYTPEKGEIFLRWFEDERGVVFEVEDTGVGIAPQHIERLTERFYRVDPGRSREVGGTGLGLAIVKHGLDRHHAQLEIESEPGKGSCFRCVFPAEQALHRKEM